MLPILGSDNNNEFSDMHIQEIIDEIVGKYKKQLEKCKLEKKDEILRTLDEMRPDETEQMLGNSIMYSRLVQRNY